MLQQFVCLVPKSREGPAHAKRGLNVNIVVPDRMLGFFQHEATMDLIFFVTVVGVPEKAGELSFYSCNEAGVAVGEALLDDVFRPREDSTDSVIGGDAFNAAG